MSVRDILDKKYNTFPFEGKWKEAFGTPERTGVWFIWGGSGNGKTSFVMQLCKELCKYDRVVYDSLEEGACLTVQNNLRIHGMSEVSRRLAFIQEDMEALKTRLRQHKSYNIVVVDSFQYTRMSYRDYISLKEAFPNKLFIFISHAKGKNPKGDAAESVMYDATLKIWVEGGKAFSKGRFIGETGEYIAYPKLAEEYWSDSGIKMGAMNKTKVYQLGMEPQYAAHVLLLWEEGEYSCDIRVRRARTEGLIVVEVENLELANKIVNATRCKVAIKENRTT